MVPIVLQVKEGLSLINGTQLTTAYACRVWVEAELLWKTATLALAMSTIGFRANPTVKHRVEVFELHHPATVYAGLGSRSGCRRSVSLPKPRTGNPRLLPPRPPGDMEQYGRKQSNARNGFWKK